MIRRLIPKAAKLWLAARIKGIASEADPPVSARKYIPYERSAPSYLIPKQPHPGYETCDLGLAIPPRDLWLGYADTKEQYLAGGQAHVSTMLALVKTSGFSFARENRILDFGCGAGRMTRHLKSLSDICDIWGADISGPHIFWAKQHLNPPFHFVLTTTIPHLPFEDRSFHFIYCGSVFTHIDDLTEAWLCELRRILSPHGRLYLTIHDGHTLELLEGAYSETGLAKHMKTNAIYNASKETLGMLAIDRDTSSQISYDVEYFCKTLTSLAFHVLSITQEAYGYQTAILVERK
jgi:ubiquinone/menaquinone biosynthesis C-methylase UbiE